MKALTILQPWASVIACGAKRIETRIWYTSYRGLLAIHAGLRFHPREQAERSNDPVWQAIAKERGYHSTFQWQRELPYGAIIAVAELVNCIPTDDLYEGNPIDGPSPYGVTGLERALGDYTPGRYGWVLRNVRALPEPVPCRGRHGLWTPPADVLAQVEAQR